jgi:hypothetical protein
VMVVLKHGVHFDAVQVMHGGTIVPSCWTRFYCDLECWEPGSIRLCVYAKDAWKHSFGNRWLLWLSLIWKCIEVCVVQAWFSVCMQLAFLYEKNIDTLVDYECFEEMCSIKFLDMYSFPKFCVSVVWRWFCFGFCTSIKLLCVLVKLIPILVVNVIPICGVDALARTVTGPGCVLFECNAVAAAYMCNPIGGADSCIKYVSGQRHIFPLCGYDNVTRILTGGRRVYLECNADVAEFVSSMHCFVKEARNCRRTVVCFPRLMLRERNDSGQSRECVDGDIDETRNPRGPRQGGDFVGESRSFLSNTGSDPNYRVTRI